MCSICSCQLNIWHAGHSLAPILNWFLLPELTRSLLQLTHGLSRSYTTIGSSPPENSELQITLIEWRCQYEESNWDWWIARTAITCPKNLTLPNFAISIVRPSSNLGGLRKWTNFVEPVQSYEFLKARWCQKVKPNRAWCKKRKFQNFCSFLSKFYFFNIVSQFWTQNYSNEPKTTSLASVFVEKSSVEILGGAEIRPFWKKIDLKANF